MSGSYSASPNPDYSRLGPPVPSAAHMDSQGLRFNDSPISGDGPSPHLNTALGDETTSRISGSPKPLKVSKINIFLVLSSANS